jgi:ferredoxin
LRIVTGLAVLAAFLVIFTGAGATLMAAAKLQFLPALLSTGAGIGWIAVGAGVAFVLAALLFGRVYCSFCCPLGILQDAIRWIFRRRRTGIQPDYKKIRYGVLALVLLTMLAGIAAPLGGLEPFSFFGRIANGLWRPVVVWGNQLLWRSTRADWVSPLDYHPWSGPVLMLTLVSFAVLIALVIWRGRIFCQTLCPAGALLGLLARHSRYRLRIDAGRCGGCRQCEKVCKSGCIDFAAPSLDFERCVMCFDCVSVCKFGAVAFGRGTAAASAKKIEEVADPARRKFLALTGGALAGGAAAALLLRRRRKNAALPAAKPVMPPGAGSFAEFNARCTGCQLCVAGCPGKTLKPADLEYGWSGIGQPRLSFEVGKCEFDCNRCGSVCPTGALRKVRLRDKQRLRIGMAEYLESRCVVVTDGKDCGACAEHCPTGALQMAEYRDGLRIPHLIPELCIGCGSCEYICPMKPKAILVTGIDRQLPAADPVEMLKKPKSSGGSGGSFEFPF